MTRLSSVLLALCGSLATIPCGALTLATGGEAAVEIRLADDADIGERHAARELAHYLATATGARFEIVSEEQASGSRPGILVGPTRVARQAGPDPDLLGPEEWIVRTVGRDLLLYGGRPRGTLYAVYRFLREEVGVRWWTPFEEWVPERPHLRVPKLNRRGAPAFAYRDVFGLDGPPAFRARHGLNGHFSRLGEEYGGSERYGPPRHVHTFHDYVPPEELLGVRPELFAERGGVRTGGKAQLCLTEPGLLPVVRSRLVSYIERSRVEAKSRGETPPKLFSFSPNDWGGACRCERCMASEARHRSAAGPLVEFVNLLADSIRDDYPEILLDTLAYMHTLPPPSALRLRDNVVLRLSALQRRDFSLPLSDAAHDDLRRTIRGWIRVAPRLRIWDYAVVYGEHGEFPLPNVPILASDLRTYADWGIDGVFVQHDFPLSSDMRALKQWILLRLMQDPAGDSDSLVKEFTHGYYGPAGSWIRRYLETLERQIASRPARIGFTAPAEEYSYLDAPFLLEAHRQFDAAERKVAGDGVLLRRVQRARLTLDRATLWRWETVFGADLRVRNLSRAAVSERYRATWYAEIGLRMPAQGRPAARAEVDREIAFLDARFHD